MSNQDGQPAGFLRRLWARRWFRVLAVAAAVLVPAAAGGGTLAFRYVKTDPDFCVSCHLMEGPAEKWRHSAHKEVSCQTCHRADIFQEARLGYAAFVERKEEIGRHTKLDVAICAECHISSDSRWKQIITTPGHRTHFAQRDISCLKCHATRVHEFKADVQACVNCHGVEHLRLEKMEKLHCLGCHDFLGKKNGSLRPTEATCRECHTAEKRPVAKGHADCLGCHRPHGKPLDDPVDCIACHKAVLDPGSKHYKDERLQSCRECHEPHEK